MATVPDLCKALGKLRGLSESELRQVARALQGARLLPKADRHQRRRPPEITSKDCAVFLMGVAASRTSGLRTPDKIGPRVRRFQRLVRSNLYGRPVSFLETLVELIDRYRDPTWQPDRRYFWMPTRLLFINDERAPEAWIEFQGISLTPEEADRIWQEMDADPKRADMAKLFSKVPPSQSSKSKTTPTQRPLQHFDEFLDERAINRGDYDRDPRHEDYFADGCTFLGGVFYRLAELLGPIESERSAG